MKKSKLYLKLFISTFYISAFTFGGGYVIVPLLKKKFVEEFKWIEEQEMLNLIAIAQTAPGPIAVNTSMLIGYKIAGIPGALFTVTGTVLPPFIILSVISLFYNAFRNNAVVSAVLKGMQAGVAAVIADVVLGLGQNVVKQKEITSIAIMIGAFITIYWLKINIVLIIIACGLIGLIKYFVLKRRKESA